MSPVNQVILQKDRNLKSEIDPPKYPRILEPFEGRVDGLHPLDQIMTVFSGRSMRSI